MEEELERFSAVRPITLILPALYGELQRPALGRIVEELKQVKYLRQIVVALGGADRDDFQHAKEFFAVLPQNVRIIWTGGERIGGLFEMLARHQLKIGADGKGRSVWLALGYTLAEGGSHMAAFHDCDIINFDRELLARLCYPVANPNLNYEFSKGYYTRVTDRFYGRVTRLFITPLIRAMEKTFGYMPVLAYLNSFRYPLAGEFALTMELARNNRIQGDWGLDFGVLAEV
ncbi:MAG: glycosyl transferase, partial [bacterium]